MNNFQEALRYMNQTIYEPKTNNSRIHSRRKTKC